MENGYKDNGVELVCGKREAQHQETRDGDSASEAYYSNKKRWIDIPNKEDSLNAIKTLYHVLSENKRMSSLQMDVLKCLKII